MLCPLADIPVWVKTWVRLFFPDEIQHLLDVLLSKRHLLVINDQARYAHHVVLIFEILKMANVVHMGRHIWILCCDPLGSYHQVGTHRT